MTHERVGGWSTERPPDAPAEPMSGEADDPGHPRPRILHPSSFILSTLSLRHLGRERLRSALVLFGIALGVAVFVSVRVANISVLEAFRTTLNVVSGPANLILRPASGPLPDSTFAQVWRTPGVLAAAPRVEATLPLASVPSGHEGAIVPRGAGLMLLGLDPFTQADLEAVPGLSTSEEAAGKAEGRPDLRFFTRRDAILVTDSFARRQGLRPGSTLRVLVDGQPRRLWVLGVLPPSGLSRAFGGDVGVMDIANAQELLGKVGRLDRVDVRTAPDAEAAVTARLRRLLPQGVALGPPSTRMRQAHQMVSAFELNLTALSLISALVGVFIIYNALLIAVLKRRREIATLRALGVARAGIAGLFLGESALLGLLGSGLGLLLGTWLARYTLQAVSGTISTLYLQVRARELVVTPGTLLLGLGLGLGSTLLAGLAPALEAAGTPPAETLREQTAARPARRRAGPWLAAGLTLLALAGAASVTPGVREVKAAGFAGAFALLLGAALATPALISCLGRWTHLLYQGAFGVTGELAVHEVRAALDRSAAVVSALGVAVAMLIGLALMVGSFRRTVEVWIGQSIHADLYIGPAGQAIAGSEAALPPPVLEAIRSLPGVLAIDSYRSRPLPLGDSQVMLSAPDAAVLGRYGARAFRRGSSRELLSGLAGQEAAVVSENLARRFHVGEGDRLTLASPTGPVTLTIRGVYYDYTTDAGVLMMDRAVYARRWRDPAVNNVALFLKPGVSAESVRRQLLDRVAGRYELQVTNNRELRRTILDVFDQTFAITYALEAIAVLVAMLGIGNALVAILLQRQREIGILRAIGASRGQVAGISLLEASVLALWGHLVGSLSGAALALHLVYVINRQFFGWTLQFHLALWPFAVSLALVLAAALVAALPPARMAVRIPVAEAVRME